MAAFYHVVRRVAIYLRYHEAGLVVAYFVLLGLGFLDLVTLWLFKFLDHLHIRISLFGLCFIQKLLRGHFGAFLGFQSLAGGF